MTDTICTPYAVFHLSTHECDEMNRYIHDPEDLFWPGWYWTPAGDDDAHGPYGNRSAAEYRARIQCS